MEVQKSPHWSEKINHIRALSDKKAIEKAKKTLPYFTGSGTFSTRNNDGLIQHSGKLIIDFDKLVDESGDTQALDSAIFQLKSDKYTEYLYRSCSGRGLAVVVSIDPNKHLESFLYLENYYQDNYRLTIDKSCKDVSRPRYISYDPDLFHNPEAEFVLLKATTIAIDSDDELYAKAVDIFNKKNQFIEGNRHFYLLTLAFWLNKVGVSEGYARQQMCADFVSAEKTPKEINSIVTYCYKNTIDHGTFQLTNKIKDLPSEAQKTFKEAYRYAHSVNHAGRKYTQDDVDYVCRNQYLSQQIVENIFQYVFAEYKEEHGLDDMSPIKRVELFIRRRWELLRNEVTQRVECRQRGTSDAFSNANADSICRALEHSGYKIALDRLKSLLRSDFVEVYNPFLTYFHNLPEWDGVDYIEELAGFVTTTDQEFWVKQFKKAIVRNIACACYGYNNRIIITLVGEQQEKGKSRFIEFLCPPELANYYTEANLDQSKDSEIQLAENFIWNLEELAGLESWEVNKLKSIISRSSIKTRRSYAEYAEKYPRRANFWASTNNVDFLGDDQNTRWLCFEVVDIDHDYNNFITGVRKVDINNVWAQAWALYNSGFNFQLDKEDMSKRETTNKRYERIMLEKDLIQKFLDPCERKAGDFLTTSDILMKVNEMTDNKYTNKLAVLAISKALKQLGFLSDVRTTGGKTMRGWWVSNKKTWAPGDAYNGTGTAVIEFKEGDDLPF
jgi:hypothetical protein